MQSYNLYQNNLYNQLNQLKNQLFNCIYPDLSLINYEYQVIQPEAAKIRYSNIKISFSNTDNHIWTLIFGGNYTKNKFIILFQIDPNCNIGDKLKVNEITFQNSTIQGYLVINNQIFGISGEPATQSEPMVRFIFDGGKGFFYLYLNLPENSGSLFANLILDDSKCTSNKWCNCVTSDLGTQTKYCVTNQAYCCGGGNCEYNCPGKNSFCGDCGGSCSYYDPCPAPF